MENKTLMIAGIAVFALLVVGAFAMYSGPLGISFSPTNGTNGTTTCYDSDGGLNYNVSGTVTRTVNGVAATYTDSCYTARVLTERYCSGSNAYSQSYTCPGSCLNGACVSAACVENWVCTAWGSCNNGTQTRTCTDQNKCGTTKGKPASSQKCTANGTATCYDSDGGINYNVKGFVNYSTTYGPNLIYDMCNGTSKVIEYYCNGNNPTTSIGTCASGKTCSDGACVSSNSTYSCTDTDGGINYNVRGTASSTYNGASLTDQCMGSYLMEAYCNGYYISNATYTCPNGCSSGACMSGNPGNGTGNMT